jgi:N-acetyl-anhydromuramyl-L-alanine amidase AmpD
MESDRTHKLAHGPALRSVDFIVLHATAGYNAQTAVEAMERRNVSAHVVIERDGSLVRCVPDQHRAWHAGGSVWQGRGDANSRSLGVEIVNFGPVERAAVDHDYDGEDRFWPAAHGIVEVPPLTSVGHVRGEQDVVVVTRSGPIAREQGHAGPAYPDAQIERVVDIVAQWCNRRQVIVENVVGHCHVQPVKADPYAWFPWARVRAMLRQRVVYRGRGRDVVKALQSHLDRLGCRPGAVDGAPGPMTARAWAEAVQRYGIEVPPLAFDYPDARHVRDDYGRACDALVAVYPPSEVRR